MFCTNCGKPVEAQQNYCGYCGARVDRSNADDTTSGARDNWRDGFDYMAIINQPEVKHVIEIARKRSGQRISAEDFLGLLKPVIPVGGNAVLTVASKFWYNTTASASWVHRNPESRAYPNGPGAVIAAFCAALAERSIDVQDVKTSSSHCELRALLPVTLTRPQFNLTAHLSRRNSETLIELEAAAPLGRLSTRYSSRKQKEILDSTAEYLGELRSQI